MSEWFEDESFWIETYPFIFPESRIEATEEEIDKILQLVECPGKSVLDLCCGPGRCSVALAKRGFTVTGVDRTAFLLEKAKARAKAEAVDIEWIQQDMREFVRPEGFDLVLSMFSSFGYFDDKTEDIRVLRNIFTSLKQEGNDQEHATC
jgi:2-polyprenyl-3-methyl-5-hydroxy-6-metoxy-1,4-benzoquinol methylase